MEKKYSSLKEFYPYYLTEHQHPTSRILHFIGTGLVFVILILSVVRNEYSWMISIPIVGYGFAWVGHFFFEKNKPATFKYPFYSLASDFILFYELLTGKQKFVPSSKPS
ncbi:DUF962 domain-containing protein [Algoriphagus sp. AK58]|uniref:DUF962 domain-containing protein n=1 Tax=Algoriphagus sp. AK58 TaxID=1406877 RepID=UPI00165071B6|nr:DUF962 domain-containing protein [Algoriphagus sp. AK58]MBC6367934.1 DUF962 domain-containing protein [Algoriphagus sp. AK58]